MDESRRRPTAIVRFLDGGVVDSALPAAAGDRGRAVLGFDADIDQVSGPDRCGSKQAAGPSHGWSWRFRRVVPATLSGAGR
ncbi:hypothetical protein GCM10023205_19960 [Yinghuangia aomiensis]|uniref:Uncharacterized protein n=1 Tax=Yinghuangia aomiensis TaxID=676205 RepID=A0ABP9H0B7_9ACTN